MQWYKHFTETMSSSKPSFHFLLSKLLGMLQIMFFLVDYHQDILNLSLQEFSRPDVVNIAETADPTDLGRLLQLVLSKFFKHY